MFDNEDDDYGPHEAHPADNWAVLASAVLFAVYMIMSVLQWRLSAHSAVLPCKILARLFVRAFFCNS